MLCVVLGWQPCTALPSSAQRCAQQVCSTMQYAVASCPYCCQLNLCIWMMCYFLRQTQDQHCILKSQAANWYWKYTQSQQRLWREQEKVDRHCCHCYCYNCNSNSKIQTGNIRCLHKELQNKLKNNLELKPAAEAEALQIQLDNENKNDVVVDAAFCIGKTKTGSALRCS